MIIRRMCVRVTVCVCGETEAEREKRKSEGGRKKGRK